MTDNVLAVCEEVGQTGGCGAAFCCNQQFVVQLSPIQDKETKVKGPGEAICARIRCSEGCSMTIPRQVGGR